LLERRLLLLLGGRLDLVAVALAVIELDEAGAEALPRLALQLEIDGGGDGRAEAEELLLAVATEELLVGGVDELLRALGERVIRRRRHEVQRCVDELLGLARGGEAVAHHLPEDIDLPRLRLLGVLVRRALARRLRHRREEGRLA